MSDVALGQPKTNLEKIDQKTLVGLLRSGLSLEQIEALEEPKLKWFALANEFDFDELKETIGLLAGIGVMKEHQLVIFNGWVSEQGISLKQLQEAAKIIALHSDNESEASRRRRLTGAFFAYTTSRERGINHFDLIEALKLDLDLEKYKILRVDLNKFHDQALHLLATYGVYVRALVNIMDTDIPESEILEFLNTSPKRQWYSDYIELRKAGVRHSEACDYIALYPNTELYLALLQRGLNHQEIVALAHYGIVSKLSRHFDKNSSTQLNFSAREVALILQLPMYCQKVISKLIENDLRSRY